uniref:Uncharacterized protein n=1 Tax=Colletotrichum fructicola (strain Nara gc5) TaxID=1213859 RepID=L2G411_COLFN
MAVQNAMFGDCSDSNAVSYPIETCSFFSDNTNTTAPLDPQLFEFLNLANNDMTWSYPTYGWNLSCESSAENLLEGGMSSAYCLESMHLHGGCTDGSPAAAPGLVYATPVEPLQPWTYVLGAQPMLQQDFALENGGCWGKASLAR